MDETIKSYKAFDENMQCRGFQYEVGKEYDMDGDIQCCKRGFHACKSPFEVWNYYDMLTSRFAEVEQSGKISTKDGTTKVCSSHIKIKAELKLADIINIGVEWLKELTSSSKIKDDDGFDKKQISLSGSCAKIGLSRDYTLIGSSGSYAKIGSSGSSAIIGSTGAHTLIGSSGIYAKIGSSGDYALIGSSGDSAKIGSSGDSAKIGSSGDSAKIGSSGSSAKIGSSGDYAKIDSTGENAVIMCAGRDSIAKAKIGSWITFAEWGWVDNKCYQVPVCVKTERVDGIRIKPDTWYELKNGEFVEVKI